MELVLTAARIPTYSYVVRSHVYVIQYCLLRQFKIGSAMYITLVAGKGPPTTCTVFYLVCVEGFAPEAPAQPAFACVLSSRMTLGSLLTGESSTAVS